MSDYLKNRGRQTQHESTRKPATLARKRRRAELTGNEIEALPVLGAGFHLAGEQVELDRLPVGLLAKSRGEIHDHGLTAALKLGRPGPGRPPAQWVQLATRRLSGGEGGGARESLTGRDRARSSSGNPPLPPESRKVHPPPQTGGGTENWKRARRALKPQRREPLPVREQGKRQEDSVKTENHADARRRQRRVQVSILMLIEVKVFRRGVSITSDY